MSSFFKITTTVKNSMLNDLSAEIGPNAVIKLYSAPMISTFAEAISTQVLLSTHAAAAGAFAPAASAGAATANAIADGTGSAGATSGGTAAVFGIIEDSGGTRRATFSVGATGCDLNMTPDSVIKTSQVVKIDSLTLTAAN